MAVIVTNREVPIRCVTCWHHMNCEYWEQTVEGYKNRNCPIKALDQKPRTGRWKAFIHNAYHGIDEDGEPIWREVTVYHCSQCNRRTVIKEKYCPKCGAKMVELQESEDKE